MGCVLTPVLGEVRSKVPAAARFSHEWQLSVAKAKRLLDSASQRHGLESTTARASARADARARKNIEKAQRHQKRMADRRRSEEPVFQVGSGVLLSTSNIQLKNPGARKLLPNWIGPFTVTQRVGKVAYRLALPPGLRSHNVFM